MLELHMLNEVERNGRESLEKDFLSAPKSLLQAPPVGGWEGGTGRRAGRRPRAPAPPENPRGAWEG